MAVSYLKLKVSSSDQCLNIFLLTTQEGQYACQGVDPSTDNFLWVLTPAPNNTGWFLLQVKYSGQYLNVLNNATNNGATVGQNSLADTSNPPPNFLWKLSNAPKNNGLCLLQVKSTEQYLNIRDGGDMNGQPACQGVLGNLNNIPPNFLWQINYVGETTDVHTVTVSATTAKPYPPSLSDDEGHQADTEDGDKNMTTLVGPGDVVTWQKGGNISSLDNVFETAGTDLFIVDPSPGNNGTWVGIVGSMDSGAEEAYSITYTVGGQSHTQDPRLKMR